MKKLLLKIFMVSLAACTMSSAFAADGIVVSPPTAGVVIFGLPQGSDALSALTVESIESLRRAFDECGRFIPAGERSLRWALERVRDRPVPGTDPYARAAALLNADLYIVVSVGQSGNVFSAEARMISLSPESGKFEGAIRVRSRIMMNIPLKLAREATELHRGVPVHASVIKDLGEGLVLIDAGQWHGLNEGRYRTSSGLDLEIVQASRYESAARLQGQAPADEKVSILLYPDVNRRVAWLESAVRENAEKRYGLGERQVRGEDPRKRYLQGMCIINPGGNICLPVYGAYLSTHYLGFKDASPDIYGLSLSSLGLGTQLLLPSVATGFRAGFLPWERDDDKSEKMQRLHVYLWSSIPLTLTVSYLDQLAVQFRRSELIPPFFSDRDVMAATLSAVVPGGGLFYKGRRAEGWCFYFAEMVTAGYGIYQYGSGDSGTYALALLGVIKAADIVYAWLARPGYAFYNFETDTGKDAASVSLGVYRTREKECIYTAGVTGAY